MTNATAGQKEFERLEDSLRFPRTGKFYKLTRSLTRKEHKALINCVARPLVDDDMHKLSGLKEPAVEAVRASKIGSWDVKGVASTVKAFGTLYIQPILESPGFAQPAAGLKELRFAHVLILEGAVKKGPAVGQRYAFVNCDTLGDPFDSVKPEVAFMRTVAQPLSRNELLNPFLSSNLVPGEAVRIEALNMRLMNMSRVGLRRKAVEAYNVEASVGSLGLHRSIPGTLKVRLPRDSGVGTAVTISPNRQSIRVGSSRVKLSSLTQWFAQCVVRLNEENGATALGNTFLSEMAEPLETLDLVEPDSFLLDFSALVDDGLGESATWERASATPDYWEDISFVDAAFDGPVTLEKVPPPKPALVASSTTAASPPAAPKHASSVRKYTGTINDGVSTSVTVVLEVDGATCRFSTIPSGVLGNIRTTGGEFPFEQMVTRAKALRVSFDGGRVLYAAEGAHRSGNLKLAVQRLQASIHGTKSFDNVTTEKGEEDEFLSSFTSFPEGSTFQAIETDSTVAPGATLVCGDGTLEVFDYLDIGLKDKRLRWLHAKVQRTSSKAAKAAAKAAATAVPARAKKPKPVLKTMGGLKGSLSASSLQEVVGQAVKNLAFLRRDPTEQTFKDEVKRWEGVCECPKVAKIRRIRRGEKPGDEVSAILADPSARHEVAIVVPAYSKKRLVAEFAKIEHGAADQTSVQMFWLLSGFTHACLEVGVTPLIFMRE